MWIRQDCSNYWTATEIYEALKKYVNMNLDGLRDAIVKMLGRDLAIAREREACDYSGAEIWKNWRVICLHASKGKALPH